jgi:hypothetical protein
VRNDPALFRSVAHADAESIEAGEVSVNEGHPFANARPSRFPIGSILAASDVAALLTGGADLDPIPCRAFRGGVNSPSRPELQLPITDSLRKMAPLGSVSEQRKIQEQSGKKASRRVGKRYATREELSPRTPESAK